MVRLSGWSKLQALMRAELLHLTTINASDRLWQMPFAAALASGLPLLVGAYFDRMDYGLISSLGGLVFLYLPNTPMSHRMVSLMACAFGMVACYALGVMSHFFPPLMMWVLMFIAILVTMVCRFYRLGQPGSLFFVMTASIGAYSPGDVLQVPLKVGLLTMGCLLACLIAFFYSIYILRLQAPKPVAPLPPASFDFVVFDSVVIGVFVGISLALAQALELERAYWVPVSCLAVMQGASLRAVWNKQLQRIIGTGIGLLLSWGVHCFEIRRDRFLRRHRCLRHRPRTHAQCHERSRYKARRYQASNLASHHISKARTMQADTPDQTDDAAQDGIEKPRLNQ